MMPRCPTLTLRLLLSGACMLPLIQAHDNTRTNSREIRVQLAADHQLVARYDRIEFEITAPTDYANVFDPDEVSVDLELTDPKGDRVMVPAFCYQPFERRTLARADHIVTWLYPVGALQWKARFAPSELGTYRARVALTDSHGTSRSESIGFKSVPSDRRGFLQVSREDARFFATSDGRPFFPIGQNLAFIGESQFLNLIRAERTLQRLAAHEANYARIWAGCHDWAMGIEARKSAFGRSWDWRPPFGPHPDDPNLQCVRLRGEAGTHIQVNPSHRVALRPRTSYRLSGRMQSEDAAALVVVVGDRSLSEPVRSGEKAWVIWKLEFTTGPNEHWLGEVTLRLAETGTAWIDSLSLRELDGGPELFWEADPNRPARGVYNQPDSYILDEVLTAANQHGILIQLTLLTRDLYMEDLADETSVAYERAIADARKLMRYAVGRWGYSTSVAVWEYFNEMDPNRPTDRFYRELAETLDRIDPYRHLRSTSTWHPSPRDWQLPWLDLADEHFYLRPGDYERFRDEVDAVLDRVALLRRHAPERPVLLGEFGLANERWQPTREMLQRSEVVDFHNALWASALSGASGTALFWWWDQLDPHDHYPHYQPLARFLEDIPWTSGSLRPVQASVHTLAAGGQPPVPDETVVVVGLGGQDHAHLWLFHADASWNQTVVAARTPSMLQGRILVVEGLADGPFEIRWFDTRQGQEISETKGTVERNQLRVSVPGFDRDIACRLRRE
jgi:hypothetical protein